MNSPYLSPSSSSDPRTRTDSIFPIHLQDTAGIKKRSNSRSSRPRSISSANIERHPELLPDQIQDRLNLNSNGWTANTHSPQPQHQPTSFNSSSDPQPTQQAGETLTLPGFQSFQNSYNRFGPASRDSKHPPHTTPTDMASLSYLPPPHYGHMAFHDPSFDHGYQQHESNSHIHPSSNFGFIFGTSAPSQQSIYAPGPLDMEPAYSTAPLEPSLNHVSEPTMDNLNRAVSPFHPSNYDTLEYPLSSTTTRTLANRSISHSPLSQHMDPLTPPLTAGLDSVQPQLATSPGAQTSMDRMRSPSIYDAQSYSSSYAAPGVQASQPLFPAPQSYSYPPPAINARQQVPRNSSDSQVRGLVNQKPKPQCWEHGCNGREFSTFSNLLRHQREKSGTAAKSYCPKCGAEFTRTTARNGHLAHEKCSKQRRTSEAK
ncbi:hypothetical protein E4T50_11563 [Aureobasidium sp. EXF-12298]|nr:hypothetical protein E4T50_11563 [Aureobasidium sp. EXF-12298]